MSNSEYDVIIVGAGSAGCVLAARLSESAERTVLLLEAGDDYEQAEKRPSDFTLPGAPAVVNSHYYWGFEGVPTEKAERAPLFIVRGRVLGGSGAINGTSFQRGEPDDYNSWDVAEWAFERVLEAFIRLETDADYGDSSFHGAYGPMPVRRHPPEEWTEFHHAFFDAAQGYGFEVQADMNSPTRSGVGAIPRNVRENVRIDTAVAFLAEARMRPNLTVQGNSVATRVVFEGTRAVGVLVKQGDGSDTLIRGAEIILSAGGIGSPQLLFASGVGDGAELRRRGLAVIADSPGVGTGLQDHAIVSLKIEPRPGLQFSSGSPPSPIVILHSLADGEKNNTQFQAPYHAGSVLMDESVSISCHLNRERSTGKLIFADDPREAPVLHFNYLADSQDRAVFREAVRLGRELARIEPLADCVGRWLGPDDDTVSSDCRLDEWIASNVGTAYHSCGTCSVGNDPAEGAVVDPHLRVFGTEGLRVADLSIAPRVPRANTNATAVMIGEHSASLIASTL